MQPAAFYLTLLDLWGNRKDLLLSLQLFSWPLQILLLPEFSKSSQIPASIHSHTLTLGIGKNGIRWECSTEILSVWQFHLVAYTCRGGSHWQGCHGYLPAWPKFPQAPYQPLRHQFPCYQVSDKLCGCFTVLIWPLSTHLTATFCIWLPLRHGISIS